MRASAVLLLVFIPALSSDAQLTMHQPMHAATDAVADLLMQQASGTSREPQSVPMEMLSTTAGRWTLMLHGLAFLDHVNESGPRGGMKTFSTNWAMGMASRPLAGGTLMLRSMLSLEPATITARKYPELFQTGETAYGKQLIDGQHPHDFFMEVAAEYAHAFGRTIEYVYVAPVGDPAVGPVAFPHRASAMEMPQAVLSHHEQDSTHISYNVITVGTVIGPATLEASAFHGGEPNEHRWSINGGPIDSWATRFRLQPVRDLDMQVSYARLTNPERTEPGYATRGTASVSYSVPFRRGEWDSSVVFGRVYKEAHGQTLNADLAETSLRVFERHHFSARAEVDDKDELFPHPILSRVPRPPIPARIFRIRAYTAGYTFDLLTGAVRTGIGANVTWYRFPAILNGFYGENPHSVYVYLRVRLGASGHAMGHHMDMPM